MNGEGQGLILSNEGDSVTWTGHGVGKPTGKGLASSWGYSLVMRTSSTKWARLNGVLAIGEWEIDEAGNGRAQVWEWKQRVRKGTGLMDQRRAVSTGL